MRACAGDMGGLGLMGLITSLMRMVYLPTAKLLPNKEPLLAACCYVVDK
jgi:hypothetical protein